MSSCCIVTSPAQLVDEYAELLNNIVNYPATILKSSQSLPTAIFRLAFLCFLAPQVLAQTTSELTQTISDILIVLDSDGRSHTVQHTVATNGPLLKLTLPGSAIPQEVMFFGPEHLRLTAQHKTSPSIIEITNGSAFTRYQHQYGTEVQQVRPGHFVLTTFSVPTNIDLNGESLTHSSISWIFPNEFELESYSIADYDTGRWVSTNNILTFYHTGTTAVELSINYKKNTGTITGDVTDTTDTTDTTDCNASEADACANDEDEDGVPDYRDICADEIEVRVNTLGCAQGSAMILGDVEFTSGKTYLDVTARKTLDKTARAILKSEHTLFEISAHTDNNGATRNNQQLSDKRADAVRHYLMLKGVHPNTIRALGYGEQYPIRDNASADGRRANRRIELVIIQ